MSEPLYIDVHVAQFGWTANTDPRTLPGNISSRSSHYGDTWREKTFAPEAVAFDTRTIPEDSIVTFAVCGPLYDMQVPPGQISGMLSGARPFDPRPQFGRPEACARLGNAQGFDIVALDVYATLARRYGARVFCPNTEQDISHAEVVRRVNAYHESLAPVAA